MVIREVTTTSIHFTWGEVTGEHNGYTLQISEDAGSQIAPPGLPTVNVFRNLLPGREYTIQVSTSNDALPTGSKVVRTSEFLFFFDTGKTHFRVHILFKV